MIFLEDLTARYWPFFLAASLLFLLWRLGGHSLQGRGLARRFPLLMALADLLMIPLLVAVFGGLVKLAATGVGLSGFDGKAVRTGTLVVGYLISGWLLAHLIELMLLARADDKISERVPKLVVGLVYGALMLLGLGLLLWLQGYSFTGIWVSTGVAAAVLGLALQRTLGDLFSGIALGIERPFKLGDWIELADGTVGQVIDLNWRATWLRGWDNSTHVIPNSQMAGQPLKNLHDEQHLFAPWYFVKIPAEVDPRFATALILDAALRCESVLKVPHPVVRLADASSIPYSYMVWVHLKNYPAMFRGREELYREIHWALRQAGISLAPEVNELRMRRADAVNAEPPTIFLALKALDVGGLLTEAELDQLAAGGAYRYYDCGRVILSEGTLSDAFYVIAGGLVEAAITLPDGTRKVTEVLGTGDYFGITSMLTTNPSYLEMRAQSDVTLIRIDLDCVRALLAARPELAERFARIVKERLDAAEAVRVASRQPTRRLSLRDIRERIDGLVVRKTRA
ncbi:small-conductance mechanosensitive channel [Thioflavicoccus mobilis 8321]|uniref:Small-conductance mechanosensitive channel n=1 Tax=Thioflavicoccus mobilis 8321 TaxID=765912 RepID=L0GZE4_9GAMM|nr:mechanosensitive ion channel family protein [Thioflavicoccus mobilis]AGA90679.1 small-conductance mechanosensitive channel [Thioflavicoccus mobilis 8321]